jgi:hypothetical protein
MAAMITQPMTGLDGTIKIILSTITAATMIAPIMIVGYPSL